MVAVLWIWRMMRSFSIELLGGSGGRESGRYSFCPSYMQIFPGWRVQRLLVCCHVRKKRRRGERGEGREGTVGIVLILLMECNGGWMGRKSVCT